MTTKAYIEQLNEIYRLASSSDSDQRWEHDKERSARRLRICELVQSVLSLPAKAEQPEQKPVAIPAGHCSLHVHYSSPCAQAGQCLYASPPNLNLSQPEKDNNGRQE